MRSIYLDEATRYAENVRMQANEIRQDLERQNLSDNSSIAAMKAEKERILQEMEDIYNRAIADCDERLEELAKRKEANARRRKELEAQGVVFR